MGRNHDPRRLPISGGNLVLFVIAMFAIGIVQRVVAVRVARQGGGQPPRWWQV